MTDFFSWLTGGSVSSVVFIVTVTLVIGSTVAIYSIAFAQGREVSFWPPKIGKKPGKDDQKLTVSTGKDNQKLPVPPGKAPLSLNAKVYENYRMIDWAQVLSNAHSIDLAVTYFDSWVKSYWEPLIGFFKRGGHVRIILTNPSSTEIDIAWKRFPKYPRQEFIQKIEKTIKHLQLAFQDSRSAEGVLEVFYCDGALNYAVIRVDNCQLFLSFYEHYPKTRIGAPSILLSLEDSTFLCDYWAQEFDSLIAKSARVDPRQFVHNLNTA